MFTPRYYQELAKKKTIKFLQEAPGQHGIVVLPTGAGKSYSIADIIKYVLDNWPTTILLISHSKEILKQDYNALKSLLPDLDIGVYSASLKSKTINQVTIAGIQSIRNKAHLFQNVKLIIVDEAQLISPKQESSYMKVFNMLPKARVLGYTATPYRYKGHLTDSDHLFDKIIYEANTYDLIQKGFLSKLISKQAKNQIDRSKLKVVGGDYSKKSMSEEIDRFGLTKAICDDLLNYTDRKHWLVAAVSIEHAEHIAAYLNEQGVATYAVHSKQTPEERDLVIRLYKTGKIQAIAQVNILSVGFDFPEIDLIAILRPTKSQVFHRQLIGRGLRIAENKDDCLIRDYAGNFKALGPIDVPPETTRITQSTGGSAPTKVCPECDEIVLLSVKVCPDCGYEFPKQEKLSLDTNVTILAGEKVEKLNKYTVTEVEYKLHNKIDKPPTLRVTYRCGLVKKFNEWIAIESPTQFGNSQAVHWWSRRCETPMPNTVEEALESISILKKPTMLEVDESGKWPQIRRFYFGAQDNDIRRTN